MRFLAILPNIVNMCGLVWLSVTDMTCLYVRINFNLFANEMKFVCFRLVLEN